MDHRLVGAYLMAERGQWSTRSHVRSRPSPVCGPCAVHLQTRAFKGVRRR
jgi:hypothetical protein